MNDNKFFIEQLPTLNEVERQAYIQLSQKCCPPESQQKLTPFFEKLKDFSGDDEYMTTLNYVMEHCDNNELFFIMSLDCKQDIQTLEWRLQNSLNKNFKLSIDLPDPLKYGESASVSYDNVFEDYDKPLREQGLQMGFIDTQSDEYVIFIHQTAEVDMVEKLVNDLGYDYYDISHRPRKIIYQGKDNFKKPKFDRGLFIFWLVILLLCPLFTYITYRGYRKDGISFLVVFVAVSNLIFYVFSISALIDEWKKRR